MKTRYGVTWLGLNQSQLSVLHHSQDRDCAVRIVIRPNNGSTAKWLSFKHVKPCFTSIYIGTHKAKDYRCLVLKYNGQTTQYANNIIPALGTFIACPCFRRRGLEQRPSRKVGWFTLLTRMTWRNVITGDSTPSQSPCSRFVLVLLFSLSSRDSRSGWIVILWSFSSRKRDLTTTRRLLSAKYWRWSRETKERSRVIVSRSKLPMLCSMLWRTPRAPTLSMTISRWAANLSTVS